MIYQIGLTGAQGTGKSTLARAVTDRLEAAGVAVEHCFGLGEGAIASGLATGPSASAETVRLFANFHRAREERQAREDGAVRVFDRTLFDALAYAEVLGCLASGELEALREATIASCRRFAQLIWLRVTVDYPVLTAVDESPVFRRAIDSTIGRLARVHDIALMKHAMPRERLGDIAEEVAGRYLAR